MGRNPTPQETTRPREEQGREETLVKDHRAELSPAQLVERKLMSLAANVLPVSQLYTARLARR